MIVGQTLPHTPTGMRDHRVRPHVCDLNLSCQIALNFRNLCRIPRQPSNVVRDSEQVNVSDQKLLGSDRLPAIAWFPPTCSPSPCDGPRIRGGAGGPSACRRVSPDDNGPEGPRAPRSLETPPMAAPKDPDTNRVHRAAQGIGELDAGRWTLDVGRWTLDVGRWTLDAGRWKKLGAG